MTVGMREVALKRKELQKMTTGKTGIFLGGHFLPAVPLVAASVRRVWQATALWRSSRETRQAQRRPVPQPRWRGEAPWRLCQGGGALRRVPVGGLLLPPHGR
ncbi:hypothetical protein J2Y48_000140 [Mycoplana sp. BE70]|nr:hypothetical protein [Mycoplana sp. BE70]